MTYRLRCAPFVLSLSTIVLAVDPPRIVRDPASLPFPVLPVTDVPHHTTSDNPFEIDLRHQDCSRLDLTTRSADLAHADYDTSTKWPAADRLPPDFNPAKVAEIGKNPGLGIRSLHARGITGRGVGVAVIDQTLAVHHPEFADRLRLYEEIGYGPAMKKSGDYLYASMHGAATASIAVGKTVGVAPEADLYHIATTTFDPKGDRLYQGMPTTFAHYATAIRRILEINQTLADAHKIRAISLSIGWSKTDAGYADITAAVEEAKRQNLLVTSSSLAETYGYRFHGLGRAPNADPDDFDSYRPGAFIADEFYRLNALYFLAGMVLVPMDHRTTAGPAGNDDYAHYGEGGWSWCTPYLAGVYALACQADPALTPDRFWAAALKTARTSHFTHNNRQYTLKAILDPVALIDSLAPANATAR